MKENTDRWMELCVEATIERDPDRVRAIAKEMNELLDAKARRLGMTSASESADPHHQER